MIHWMISFVMI